MGSPEHRQPPAKTPDEEVFDEYTKLLRDHGEFQAERIIPGCYHFVINRNRIPTTNPDMPAEAVFTPAYIDEGEPAGDYVAIHFPVDQDGITKIVTFYRFQGELYVDAEYDVLQETDEQYLRRLSMRMERAHWGLEQKQEWLDMFLSEDQSAGIEDIELARRALAAIRQHFS